MRAVVQRVTRASVSVDDQYVGRIDSPGLVILLGVTHDDTTEKAHALAHKIAHLRILRPTGESTESAAGVGDISALDANAPVMVISQFTLYADTRKGRRPSWANAARSHIAQGLVDEFSAHLSSLGLTVATGQFGADMAVELVNDGPVTLTLEN